VRTAVVGRLGPGYYAITTRQFLDGVRSVTRQFFLATWALQLVAALVGVIGVVNAQLATVLDRANEISVLHTIGVATRDLTRSVILECGALGAIGGLTGLALGLMLGVQFIEVSVRRSIGMTFPFTLPPGPVLVGLVSATLVSALAGWVPARAAARLESGQRSID
jgi:putative ABC transport system permease protein